MKQQVSGDHEEAICCGLYFHHPQRNLSAALKTTARMKLCQRMGAGLIKRRGLGVEEA